MTESFKRIRDFSLKSYLISAYQKADRPFWSGFFALFLSLNLLFLYHGAEYMFGDHDWQYIKNGVALNAGLFEGRFSQFLFINMLTNGEILPIVNNALGFFGYSLGIMLLARYWHLPHNKQSYILFALFAGITPYILSFMYFAFLIMPVLSWNAFIIGGLILSERSPRLFSIQNLFAIILFTTALGGYPPVINLLGVALTARLTIYLIEQTSSLKNILLTPIANFIAAALIYKLILVWLTHTGAINSSYYNLQTTPISEWGNKALLVLTDYFKQFTVTLPFITAPFKTATLIITLTALISTLTLPHHPRVKKAPLATLALLLIPLAGLATLFLSTSLAETEFSPRIDFFGLNYAYAAMFAICLMSKNKLLKNIATLAAAFSIIYSAHTLLEAQKVWKLGFDTESLLYKRILKRYEAHPLFNPKRKYIMVQAGSPSFREKYYTGAYSHGSDDLLSISYTPGLNAGVMWNYEAQREYADKTSYVYTFRPNVEAIEAIQSAAPYPAANSVAVGGYWILTVLTKDGLKDLQARYNFF